MYEKYQPTSYSRYCSRWPEIQLMLHSGHLQFDAHEYQLPVTEYEVVNFTRIHIFFSINVTLEFFVSFFFFWFYIKKQKRTSFAFCSRLFIFNWKLVRDYVIGSNFTNVFFIVYNFFHFLFHFRSYTRSSEVLVW